MIDAAYHPVMRGGRRRPRGSAQGKGGGEGVHPVTRPALEGAKRARPAPWGPRGPAVGRRDPLIHVDLNALARDRPPAPGHITGPPGRGPLAGHPKSPTARRPPGAEPCVVCVAPRPHVDHHGGPVEVGPWRWPLHEASRRARPARGGQHRSQGPTEPIRALETRTGAWAAGRGGGGAGRPLKGPPF